MPIAISRRLQAPTITALTFQSGGINEYIPIIYPPYIGQMMDVVTWQWVILVTISVTMFLVSPWAKTATDFFKGSAEDKPTSTLFLTSSLMISWIFAKSITNAADLGSKYGMVGSISYAAYYLSFWWQVW